MAGLQTIKTGVTDSLEAMCERGRSPSAWLARRAYPMYQRRQAMRWKTDGSSEANTWPKLNPIYAERKQFLFFAYPGHGMQMGVATGLMFESVTGKKLAGDVVSEKSEGEPKSAYGHNVMISDKTLIVASDLEYTKHFSQLRSVWRFQPDFIEELRADFKKWFKQGDVQ